MACILTCSVPLCARPTGQPERQRCSTQLPHDPAPHWPCQGFSGHSSFGARAAFALACLVIRDPETAKRLQLSGAPALKPQGAHLADQLACRLYGPVHEPLWTAAAVQTAGVLIRACVRRLTSSASGELHVRSARAYTRAHCEACVRQVGDQGRRLLAAAARSECRCAG